MADRPEMSYDPEQLPGFDPTMWAWANSALPQTLKRLRANGNGALSQSVPVGGTQANQGMPLEGPASRPQQDAAPAPALPAAVAAASGQGNEDRYNARADEFTTKYFERAGQAPDMSGMQEFMRQRGQQGQGAMLAALAANFAGERFQPIQAQLLKQAAAAAEPMKVGGGMLTPDGKYVSDPFEQQNKELERLGAMAKHYDTLAQRATTAREQNEARRAAAEANNQMRLLIAQMRGGGAGGASGGGDAKTFRLEDQLRNDFNQVTKDLQGEIAATSKIGDITNAYRGARPSAMAQDSLIILLNKFLDPGSVVREGEFDRVVQAQGYLGRAQNLVTYIRGGGRLNDDMIKQINELADLYSKAAKSKIGRVATDYTDIAKKRGLDASSVITNPEFRPAGSARREAVNY